VGCTISEAEYREKGGILTKVLFIELFVVVRRAFLNKWGKLGLNQRPTGYEGGGIPNQPLPSSCYEYNDKRVKD